MCGPGTSVSDADEVINHSVYLLDTLSDMYGFLFFDSLVGVTKETMAHFLHAQCVLIIST